MISVAWRWPDRESSKATGTGKKMKTKSQKGLLLQFSGSLTGTGNLAAYQLQSGKTKKGVTTFIKNLPVTLVNVTSTSVVLIPSGKVNFTQPLQLKVTGADLADSFGRALDGGQSFSVTFGNKFVRSARFK